MDSTQPGVAQAMQLFDLLKGFLAPGVDTFSAVFANVSTCSNTS